MCREVFDDCFDFTSYYWSVRLSAASSFSFGRLHFSRNLSISPRFFKFLGTQLFVVISYNPLYFCGVGCNLSSFIPDFIYLGSLFFSWSLIRGFFNCIYPSKEPALNFIELFNSFLSLYFVYFHSDYFLFPSSIYFGF